ncbi:hypothetical protein [Runella limosa]|uniref:hypothetical protein n=1 Tax=Runella limosa TaxID=370978 RepID=UPI00042A47FF|nr:hypothetical protein [Runella limosa]
MSKQAKFIVLVLVIVIVLLLFRQANSIDENTNTTGRIGGGESSGSGSGSGSTSTTNTTPEPTVGLQITGVGQVVTGANPKLSWHTVQAPARVINLSVTPAGSYDVTVQLRNSAGTLIHAENVQGLNISAGGFPAIFFNPSDSIWGITQAGTYTIQVSLVIAGTTYTQSTTTVITNDDLGVTTNPDPAAFSTVRTDKINIVYNAETGRWNDTVSDTDGDYKAFYYLNGRPLKGQNGERIGFANIQLGAGSLVQVAKIYLHQTYYPTWEKWETEAWKTKIKEGNNYPNDFWVLTSAQQEIYTA